jgi:cyclic beta-1,2-glucan synthetase
LANFLNEKIHHKKHKRGGKKRKRDNLCFLCSLFVFFVVNNASSFDIFLFLWSLGATCLAVWGLTSRRRQEAEGDDEPIRAELCSLERLEQYARELARQHTLAPKGRRQASPLLDRLEDNGRYLTGSYRAIAENVRRGQSISPAAEWLMDNFHIVQEQLREIREDLPRHYLRELPKLAGGPYAGYPRVYAIAIALIERSDCRLDAEMLGRFVLAYQEVTPLTIGELWAVAIMLRLALVENMRRLARQTLWAQEERKRADLWADELLTASERRPGDIFIMLAERERGGEQLSTPFAVQLLQRLRDQGAGIAPALLWLEQRLAAQETTGDVMMRIEHHRQAANQVSAGNVITSMRFLSSIDYSEFFERTSLVEQALRNDPAGMHALQDFETRNRYRSVIERIAKRTGLPEVEIAGRAVSYAREASGPPENMDPARSHVGYYLIGPGRAHLEAESGYWPDPLELANRIARRYPAFFYLGTIALVTGAVLWFLLDFAHGHGAGDIELVILALLLAIPVSDLAVSAANRDLTFMTEPQVLPKLEFKDGIPQERRTMVVVPAMLTSEQNVRELIDHLEIHYLANQEENIHFALLTDFADAPQEHMPDDETLIERAGAGVRGLNARYDNGRQDRFYLFHRRRLWNEGEGCWMGWERKRGKLEEFNRLLRGSSASSYIVQIGDLSILGDVMYIITLDADTQLPRDAARRLVATIAHPLNGARYDEKAGRVTAGYGILQPRVSVTLVSAGRSLFTRIFSGNTGVDPYTMAVSDVYQDLFLEGNYVGKGIYDVDAFAAALGGRIPENAVLSHDLLEGLYARTALVTDIELFDDYPSHYHAYSARQHRWVRGDWQIIGWLLKRLPLISRWKIFDNLRRSLVAPSMLLTLACAWTVMPGPPLFWTLLILLILAFPIYSHIGNALILHPRQVPWTSHLLNIWGDALRNTYQVGLTIAFLPHQAYLMADAIIRTLWRMLITGKRRLEWITAAQAEQRLDLSSESFWTWMSPASFIAMALLALVSLAFPDRLPVAAPFLTVWLISPLIAYWVSRPLPARQIVLSERERAEMRRIARRTWRFFETFVGPEDHYLPPDNFQEDPQGVIAHRTSPTNISTYLLSTLAAHDLGYLNSSELIEDLEQTCSSLEQLERFRGHFYNWYETETLRPLMPTYISTVDSGNFAGHLIALKQGCLEVIAQPVIGENILAALGDVLASLEWELSGAKDIGDAGRMKSLGQQIAALRRRLGPAPDSLPDWVKSLDEIAAQATRIEKDVRALGEKMDLDEAIFWAEELTRAVQSHRHYLETIAPWAPINLKLNISNLKFPPGVPSLAGMPEYCDEALAQLLGPGEDHNWSSPLAGALRRSALAAAELAERYRRIAERAQQFSEEMDFGFLYDERRQLFSIGYSVVDGRLDSSYYDLLASEARLASFVAIARDQVPQQHWFRLGRPFTTTGSGRALLSWTATMFEYIMPLLVMRTYENTLLDQTYMNVVDRQIEYGAQHSVPWGISESAYNARDLALNYQYQAFGVPGLGLKRGLSDDLVIAPYATFLALMVRPHEGVRNLKRLAAAGLEGSYGYYDAIDYTSSRLPLKAVTGDSPVPGVVVRSYMAHHHGMSLVALDNLINDNAMQKRFHAEPLVQAAELLLQERIPRDAPIAHPHAEEVSAGPNVRLLTPPVTRRFTTPHTASPQAHIMSNGNYTVMITNAGGGFSRWKGMGITRWREDPTRDGWGMFCYVRDTRSGEFWSTAFQPTGRQPKSYLVTFSTDKAEFHRLDAGIETHTEIGVSPEDDAEVRRITITNRSSQTRDLEITSYCEMVLATPASDVAHPAFSNLFVQSEFIPEDASLLFTRRPRSAEEEPPWAVCVLASQGRAVGAGGASGLGGSSSTLGVEYETDRARFLGRGRTPASPLAVALGRPLSGTAGAVLDPIASLRQRLRLRPGETARVAFTIAAAATREAALALADKYHDLRAVTRALALAWTHSQVELQHLNMTAEEAHLFQQLASQAIYAGGPLRPPPDVLQRNTKQQPGLWAYGISGDLPVILVRIAETEEAEVVRQLLRAHEYWRMKGLPLDLVILNEHPSSYAQGLHEYLLSLIRTSPAQAMMDKPGGVFLRRADLMPEDDRYLLLTVARAVLVGRRGELAQQLGRQPRDIQLPPAKFSIPERALSEAPSTSGSNFQSNIEHLKFFNGLGGFTAEGREYVMILGDGGAEMATAAPSSSANAVQSASSAISNLQSATRNPQSTLPQATLPPATLPPATLPPATLPPAPWTNVVANSRFGFLATESGLGFTWSENSRENRLTPWSNDPVSDPCGEAIYLRDEETGEFWTVTPRPVRLAGAYLIRHGQGYTAYERVSHGIKQELLVFVPLDDPVKVFRLRLSNESDRRRQLSATSYAELVLGVSREASAPYIVTEVDGETGALIAVNRYNNEFAQRVAFADVNNLRRSVTANRTEFLGRNGTPESPAALKRTRLSGRTGAGLDPCAALQVMFDLAPGEEREIIFMLGEGDGIDHVHTIIRRYRSSQEVDEAFGRVQEHWDRVLGALKVRTPDAEMDLLVNRWLLYQTLACRVWGRSAFYQSGGAYGFRDQLQDVMALIYSSPQLAREQIIRAAGRQFIEGDVQHWWHPPTGRGVRTRFSDDLHWLAFVTCFYTTVTGDASILEERAPFLHGRPLEPQEDEYYGMPSTSDEQGTIYDHCVRALDRGLAVGAHGLPLMGSGDWNDGMNRVGYGGKGESVWLAWFLIATLSDFAELAGRRGDNERSRVYRGHAERLSWAVEKEAWDGEWYRRAYFDDGTPLGSANNDECRIDSIAQSWGVISGAATRERALLAMSSVEKHLVRSENKLVLLFTPPFDRSPVDPGYIKGYVPGVRENGGQYTHAAIWVVLAFALQGDGDLAFALFRMLNPICHASTEEEVMRYKIEPYVVAADVYAVGPFEGRGGWSWYTGSAGWLYRVAIEAILGFKLRGSHFTIDPCIPASWPKYEMVYSHQEARYRIVVENPHGVSRGVEMVELDGVKMEDKWVPLSGEDGMHAVRVVLGHQL